MTNSSSARASQILTVRRHQHRQIAQRVKSLAFVKNDSFVGQTANQAPARVQPQATVGGFGNVGDAEIAVRMRR